MSYEDFLDVAKDAATVNYPDAEITIQKVEKLQGESYVGLSVKPEGSNAAVTMNLQELFEEVRDDLKRLPAAMNELLFGLQEALTQIPQVDADRFTDYEKVKEQLVMQVVPVEPNKEKLATIPHKTIEDIAVVYRIEVSDSEHKNTTVLITNQMLDDYGITQEQLHQDAVVSQSENHPPTLRNLSETLFEISGGAMAVPDSPMWVATVEGGVHGAAAVQVPEFMEKAAEKLGGDFFVLPSSIHECLFIKDDGEYERSRLEAMVQGVNAAEVSEADFLSNSVYHYDSESRIFEKASTFESRVAEQAAVYQTAAPVVAQETIKVLLVEPEKHPRAVEIGTELADLQKAVGGYIETVYPFDENVGLIMNEEGKLEGLPLNRALRDDEGKIYDVVAGSFLVVGLTEDGFGSLSPDQMTRYEVKFHSPEVFIKMGKGIMAMPVTDDLADMKTDKEAALAADKVESRKSCVKKTHREKQEAR